LVKPMSEARGLAFAGLRVFLVGANVAVTNISAELLGCIAERRLYVAREKSKSCVGKIWRGPDWIVQGRSKIIEPFMATGVGATRYGDLNSDLPVCISQDFLHIQTVTSLVWSRYRSIFFRQRSQKAVHPTGWVRIRWQIAGLRSLQHGPWCY